MMPQEENRSEPLETVEDARERVAVYRLGIPQVEDLEKRFQERLSPEQRSAYRELQIRQVVHAQMREEAVLAVSVQGFPKIERRIVADLRQIDDVTILLRPIADSRRAGSVVSLQIDAEKQAAICAEIASVQRGLRGKVVVEQGLPLMERLKRAVRDNGVAAYEANLIERVPGLHLDCE